MRQCWPMCPSRRKQRTLIVRQTGAGSAQHGQAGVVRTTSSGWQQLLHAPVTPSGPTAVWTSQCTNAPGRHMPAAWGRSEISWFYCAGPGWCAGYAPAHYGTGAHVWLHRRSAAHGRLLDDRAASFHALCLNPSAQTSDCQDT